MGRTYLLFELNMLIHNRKNWLLGLALVLFFPIYFGHYSQQQIETVRDVKNEEADLFHTIFKGFPEELRETEEGQAIYNNLTEQASLINMQRFYLWDEEENSEAFIEDGLRLNELRLQMHEAGNEGVHPALVMTKEEIHQEIVLLDYYKEHHLPVTPDPFVASAFLPAALDRISGVPFVLFVLLIGSSMMQHDQLNRSVMSGLPISFMQRMLSKVGIHLAFILLFLAAGSGIALLYTGLKTGWGNFSSPLLLYEGGTYKAVSATHYMLLQAALLLFISLLLLAAFVFVQQLVKNMYASILIILSLALLPSLLSAAGVAAGWLQPLVMLDSAAVLNGVAASYYSSDTLDDRHAFIWFTGLTVFMLSVIYTANRLRHRRPAGAYRKVRL